MIPVPRPRAHGLATSFDGTEIAWKTYGDGDPVVLFVPTWNIVDSRIVGHQVAALERHATVVTFDPRGAGASGRPEHGYDFPSHAGDALAVLDATSTGRASIVTASRGINPAILLAVDSPARVDRLVAVAPYMELATEASDSERDWLDGVRRNWQAWVEAFMQLVFTEPDSDDLIAEMTEIALDATPAIVLRQELEQDWSLPSRRRADVTCPVLAIQGDADALAPVSLAREIVSTMPDAHLDVLAGAGHRPDIRTPELVNPLLLEFLLGPGG